MSKKKIITIVSVLAVILLSVSVISYSIANRGNGGNNKISDNLAQRGAGTIESTYVTNIDLIIENSKKSPIENYNIVEIIPSSASPSVLGKYISDDLFKEYVIDENSTSTPKTVMAADAIKLDVIKVSAGTTMDDKISSNILGGNSTIREILDETDLIYLSSPSYSAYDGNMSEDIYNYLHTYALGKNKPMIMDYVTQGSSGSTEKTSYTYSELVKTISNNHIRFKTFAWQPKAEAKDFFGRDTSKGSYYITYNTNNNPVNGNVLVITNSAKSDGSMYKKMDDMNPSDLVNVAYYGNYKPKSIDDYEVVSPSALTSDILDEEYDFILIENDVASDSMSKEIYTKLRSLSESGRYILYDGRLVNTSSDTTTTVPSTNNYLKLMELLVTNKGMPRYSHILPITYGFFDSLYAAGDSGIAGAKTIADIINAGDYRGSGSNGSNGKVFRVLELQPCYPIDLDLAQSRPNGQGTQYNMEDENGKKLKGNYYTSPSEVLFNVTKDEVEADTDYYDFDLSRAKIAKATGLSYNQIQVDQMSTNEFISKKSVVMETYDLVYIGGNTSALTPVGHRNLVGWMGAKDKVLKALTFFGMYTHTGQLVRLHNATSYNENMNQKIKDTPGQTKDYPYGQIYINGKPVTTYTEFNGNDINNVKYKELLDYVNNGMPIIIEKQVADAFDEVKKQEGNRLEQLKLQNIDPDCWMYKLLDKVKTAAKDSSNVVWGLDAVNNEEVLLAGNADRNFGNTLGSSLTVFKQEINNQINAVMTNSAVRPSLTVTSAPKEYSEGNANSYNKYKDGFQVKAYAKPAITGQNSRFEISLYIDVDGNGVFSEGSILGTGECAQTENYTYTEPEDDTADVPTVTLNYTLPESFYGIVSWKVVAKDVNTKLVSSVTGYAYYERDEKVDRKEIEVLEIMPRTSTLKKEMEEAIASNKFNQTKENDGHSLYLCKECQLNMYRAEYNIVNNGTVGRNTGATEKTRQGVDLGLHEHKFGIVEFDSIKQDEDWESNLADVLIGKDGDYTVDIDIMFADEFEDLVAEIQGQSEEEIEANKLLMQKAYGDIEQAEKNPNYIAAEEALKEALIDMNGNGLTMSDHFAEFAEAGEYYKVWYYNMGRDVNSVQALSHYRTLYNTYIGYHDEVVKAKKEYRKYRRLAYAAEQWIASNYSIVVLGFAEDFGGEDLNPDACQMIASYVKKGGSMLNTHDSTTKFEKAGAMNITANLREIFGMDRFHVTGVAGNDGEVDTTAEATDIPMTVSIPSSKYTADESEPADANYRLRMSVAPAGYANRQNTDITGESGNTIFYIEKDKPKKITIKYGISYDYTESDKTTYTHYYFVEGINEDSTETTFEIDGGVYSGYGSGTIGDGTGIDGTLVVEREVSQGTWQQVDSAKIVNGKASITVPQATSVKEGKSTKEFRNETIVMKNADKSYNINLVAKDSSGTGSLALVSTGDVYNDLSETMSLKFHLNLPEGSDPESVKKIPVHLYYAAGQITSYPDAEGNVTFKIKQASSSDATHITDTALKYRHFVTSDASLYFFTERAITEDYIQWNKEMLGNAFEIPSLGGEWGQWGQAMGYNSPVGMTDSYIMYSTSEGTTPYTYVEFDERNIQWDMGFDLKEENYGPNGASQVNKGIVTTYPFYISSELRIAKTHAQAYALDMEDKDVAVWYTLSAGTGTTKMGASYYAATPRDGMNNYYLYSKGNVFYCGAGHSVVTGPGRDNNDERRLFINVIVNSVRNSLAKPKITVHRKDTDGAEVTEDKNEKLNIDKSGNYSYNVDDNTEIPEFDFKVQVDTKTELGEVYVFYDLDYGVDDGKGTTNYSDAYEVNDKHVLIAEYNTKSADSGALASKELAKLRKYVEKPESGYKNLQLKPEYFEAYGGNYTYIVIQATDTNGKTAFQRIKINLIPKLWELTMTEPANNRILLDVSDRVKYNI